MNKREEDLLKAIDEYLDKGKAPNLDKENEDLFNLARSLSEVDIEVDQDIKKQTYEKIINTKEEKVKMKNNKLVKKVASFALVGFIGFSAVQTGFAQDMYNRVKNIIKLNHVSIEEEYNEGQSHKLPEQLLGKIYDEDGKVVTILNEDMRIFNKDGEEIHHIDFENKSVETEEELVQSLEIKDLKEAKELVKFSLQVPSRLPEGYEFKMVEFYGENREDLSGEYATLVYVNKDNEQEFYISERLANEENSFEGAGEGIEEVKIDGNRAIVDSRGNLDIEIDDAIVSIISGGKLTKSQSMDLVKSMK